MEGNAEGTRNNKVSRSPDTFEDHLWWKFGSIGSHGKNDGEAAFFCSAGLNMNCSADCELQGTRCQGSSKRCDLIELSKVLSSVEN